MILALDPGSVKTGVAVVYKNGSLARKKVIQTEDFEKEVQGVLDAYDIGLIVMGNGTHHKEMQLRTVMLLKEREKNVKIELVDEKYKNRDAWIDSTIQNIVNMGYFSSDRTIKEYAENIWHVEPLKLTR